eukprot:NODE_10720_length_480_cov_0.875354_g10697_i0.p2 GENE.NODE_10720_length_480_cov_0.875354_g10697_i0~~NODE_10720_length_480_cov_0.875354_g10697_i0.p2  ORF type:complete len:149 (+),score=2.02 NODE_10720_length_480_cov_0.875354_g10697_i0:2-448(+)
MGTSMMHLLQYQVAGVVVTSGSPPPGTIDQNDRHISFQEMHAHLGRRASRCHNHTGHLILQKMHHRCAHLGRVGHINHQRTITGLLNGKDQFIKKFHPERIGKPRCHQSDQIAFTRIHRPGDFIDVIAKPVGGFLHPQAGGFRYPSVA